MILNEKNSESGRESNYRVFLPTSRFGSCRRHRSPLNALDCIHCCKSIIGAIQPNNRFIILTNPEWISYVVLAMTRWRLLLVVARLIRSDWVWLEASHDPLSFYSSRRPGKPNVPGSHRHVARGNAGISELLRSGWSEPEEDSKMNSSHSSYWRRTSMSAPRSSRPCTRPLP